MDHRVLPEFAEGPDVQLRRWVRGDAETLNRLVLESIDHLRPWMPWVAAEPLPIAQRRKMIDQWESDWRGGGDVYLGIFLHGRAVGSCGLRRRIGPGGLEIGYWIHPSFLRRGLATEAGRLLSDAAFSVAAIDRVEIHHDNANRASAGIPRNLGFRLVGEKRDEVPEPGGLGISSIWRMTRNEWLQGRRRAAG